MGFTIADMDVAYKKSQVQFSIYYKDTEYLDLDKCIEVLEEFMEDPLKHISPLRMMNNQIK